MYMSHRVLKASLQKSAETWWVSLHRRQILTSARVYACDAVLLFRPDCEHALWVQTSVHAPGQFYGPDLIEIYGPDVTWSV
jgi:hypothetical protein